MSQQDALRLFQAGVGFHRAGKLDQAEISLRAALEHAPNQMEILGNLSAVLTQRGKPAEALPLLERALQLHPAHPGLHYAHGNLLMSLKRPVEAAAAYEKTPPRDPKYLDSLVALGFAKINAGEEAAAEAIWRQALDIHPNIATLHSNLAAWLFRNGRAEESLPHCRRAVELDPKLIGAYGNLANTLQRLGRLEEAIDAYRRAWELDRTDRRTFSGLALAMQYRITDPQALRATYGAWAASARTPPPAPFKNSRDPDRPLRIGYISPDFRRHVISTFMEPLFEHRTRTEAEVFCYAEVPNPDAVTERIKGLVDHWRQTNDRSAPDVAAQIRADGIDVLVDLALHTDGNRLDVLALKPAPVQVTYLGYSGTTGLAAFDYVLMDRHIAPEGGAAEALCVEKIWRLDTSYFCYRVLPDAPEVSEQPARRNGFITFGSFNNFMKISPDALALWARAMHAVPGSKIVVQTLAFGDPASRAFVERTLASHGIDADRITIRGKMPMRQYYGDISNCDICLDTLPYSGGTTTCNSLWMGVPVVTLAGRLPISRMSASLLANAGLPEMITDSPEAFVAKCAALAGDIDGLAKLRGEMREKLTASPLMDEAGAARGMERALRGMWREWCGTRDKAC